MGDLSNEDRTLVNEKLEISSYEIAAVVAETLTQLADQSLEELSSEFGKGSMKRMILAAGYTERSTVRLSPGTRPDVGWCTDHPYEDEMIQSWTCATVLQSVLNIAKLIEESERQRILSTLRMCRRAMSIGLAGADGRVTAAVTPRRGRNSAGVRNG